MNRLKRRLQPTEQDSLASVAVGCETDDAATRAIARRFAKELDLPIVEPDAEPAGAFELLLLFGSDGLSLKENQRRFSRPLRIDFCSNASLARFQGGSSRRQPLARAIGLRGSFRPTVMDATAGLGRDACHLAFMGCHVTAIERSPVLFALLSEAHARAMAHGNREVHDALARLALAFGNAYFLLPLLSTDVAPDVVYLDPMYPMRTKSALMKKEMRLCRRLVGDDPDATELFQMAMSEARRRVVVKRHRHAPALAPNPTTHIAGTVVRYDVYPCANELKKHDDSNPR